MGRCQEPLEGGGERQESLGTQRKAQPWESEGVALIGILGTKVSPLPGRAQGPPPGTRLHIQQPRSLAPGPYRPSGIPAMLALHAGLCDQQCPLTVPPTPSTLQTSAPHPQAWKRS